MKIFLGLEKYEYDFIAKIKDIPVFYGFILGDLFCDYRMFEYGYMGLCHLVSELTNSGKEVIYQTPLYITDRIFNDVKLNINYLYDKCKIKKFVVQDIALAKWISEEFEDATIIWGRMARNRNSILNRHYISFIKNIGVNAMETDIPTRINAISDFGMEIYGLYGAVKYSTVSRECYTKYFLNINDSNCERLCWNLNNYLEKDEIKMSIDGHFLGKEFVYQTDSEYWNSLKNRCLNIMFYATTLEDAIEVFNNQLECSINKD